jgi:hypothetical protein
MNLLRYCVLREYLLLLYYYMDLSDTGPVQSQFSPQPIDPLPSANPPQTPGNFQWNNQKKVFSFKKASVIFIGIFFLLSIGVGLALINSNQDVRSRAAGGTICTIQPNKKGNCPAGYTKKCNNSSGDCYCCPPAATATLVPPLSTSTPISSSTPTTGSINTPSVTPTLDPNQIQLSTLIPPLPSTAKTVQEYCQSMGTGWNCVSSCMYAASSGLAYVCGNCQPPYTTSDTDCNYVVPTTATYLWACCTNATITMTPSPTPTGSISPTPTGDGQANVMLKLQAQGTPSGTSVPITVTLISSGSSVIYFQKTLNGKVDPQGIINLPLDDIAPGKYDVYIKGWAQLERKVSDVIFDAGNQDRDLLQYILIAGDVTGDNGIPDEVIDTLDLSYIHENWSDTVSTTISPADINRDGKVNGDDINYVLQNYLLKGNKLP